MRTIATAKSVSGAPGSSYSVVSPTVTGYTPTQSTVSGTFGSTNSTVNVYYYEKTYTISFNANGGSGAPGSITKKHFTSITLPSTKPTRTGYDFLGWSTGSTAISATWSAGDTYSTNASNTLYAVWEPKTYTINYNANGGSGAPSSQTKTYGINITIPTSKPSRTGYDFVGWGYVSDATGAAYYPGDTYSTNYSRTFYAVWSPKIYTISYNANGGSGAPASQTKTYGQDITLSSTKPTRTGYTFAGWSISKNGSVSYSAGATFKGNSSTTLYAVWTCNHTSSTKKWIDSCNWQTVCDTCGATLSSGITHGPYTYSAWTYYSSTQHKRTKSCDHGDYSTTEYASHVTSTKYEQYNSSQHKYYSYCSTCGSTIGSINYGSHSFVTTTTNGVTTHKCSQCGYSYTTNVTYLVNYNANGGTGAPGLQTKTYNVALALSSTKPTRSGYTFLGWSTNSKATTAAYSAGGSYTSNSAATLYAVWSCNHSSTTKVNDTNCDWYTVCDTCGETIHNGTTHTGYVYGDWAYYSASQHRRTKNCEHGDYSAYEYGSHSTATKYEQYSSIQHKKYSYCSTCSSKIGSDSYENHTFTTSTVNGQVISVCSQCGYTTSTAATYTISFHANGGSGSPSSQTKTHGVTLTLSTVKPTRTGYSFKGWATSSTATTATYSAGGNYTGNSNATLYAVWSCNHSSTTKVNDTACDWHTVCSTCGATIGSGTTHDPYSYSSWTYDNQNQHKRTKSCEHGDYSTTEYAVHTTSIKYDKYNSAQHKVYSYCSDCASVIGEVSYANHNFTSAVSGGKTTYTCKECGYSYSEALTYTVSYNANGGSGAPSAQTKTYGVNLTLSSAKPTRTGYTFMGWATNSTSATASYSAGGSYASNADTTLYAVWTKETYSVKYDANGGSGAPSAQTKTYGTTLTLSSTKPTRFNYDFLGWSTSQSATMATYSAGGSYTANSGTTLYAVWKYNPAKYTVQYNANGGSGAPSAQTKTYGVSLTLSSMKPTRFNYDFKGWATSSTATTATYHAGDAYTVNEAATLYAIWIYNPAKYTVSYNANGGSNAPASQTKVYDVALTLTSAVPEREGYNFKGWATSSTAKSAEYASGADYTGNSALTLFAVWELKTYMVKYDVNGGSGSIASQTKQYGQALILSASVPTWYNHRFMGWATTNTSTTVEYYAGESYAANADVTLYAVWVEMNYDFSVSDLTVTPDEVDQYDKVTVRFKADNWDKNLPYENIPIQVYVGSECIYSTTVNFTKYGVQYVSFDITVGEKTGTFTVEARVNWNDHSNESRTGNNSVTASYKVVEQFETSVSEINVNGEYIEGTEVISSFYAVNESAKDIIPSNNVSFEFLVYTMNGSSVVTISQQTWNNLVIPSNGTNLVYFKWKVPDDCVGQTIYVKGSINSAKASGEKDATNNVTEYAVYPTAKVSSQTPNTRYEKNAPTTYNASVASPTVKAGSATWNMWVYEGGKIVLKSFGLTVTGTNPTVSPSIECSTAIKTGSTYEMKSGYGITVNWNPSIVAKSGYTLPGSEAYTAPQLVYATFPEFGFATAEGKYRTLEKVGTAYRFAENADSEKNERVHFIPVYVKDGAYTVSVTATGIWTPAGMITATRNANTVSINGTIYDDWYRGQK